LLLLKKVFLCPTHPGIETLPVKRDNFSSTDPIPTIFRLFESYCKDISSATSGFSGQRKRQELRRFPQCEPETHLLWDSSISKHMTSEQVIVTVNHVGFLLKQVKTFKEQVESLKSQTTSK
jgi:hypothetical protein